jgi:hypothetical protein
MAMAFIQRREVMKTEFETNDVLELGSVSVDTEGNAVPNEDQEGGQRIKLGLTDD